MLQAISGSPKEPVPGVGSTRIPAFARKFELPKSANEFVQVPMPEVEVRAAYIYRGDLETHGATPGCPGCRALLDNNRFRAKHTAECRIRLEELISQSEAGKARLERASSRMTHAIVAESKGWSPRARNEE